MKPKIQNMLKYFAIPLWAIHTTRGVRDVVKRIPKVHKRPPDILHVACKRRCALGAHDHATACQMFAAFALAFRRLWGMDSCWYEGLPDPLFPTSHACSRVPVMFSAGRLFVLESQKMSEHASNTHKPREPGTVRNRS